MKKLTVILINSLVVLATAGYMAKVNATGANPFSTDEGAANAAKAQCGIVYGKTVQSQIGYSNHLGEEYDIPCLSDKGFAAATHFENDVRTVCGIRLINQQTDLTGNCPVYMRIL